MTTFILRRLLLFIPTLLGVVSLVFFIMHATPGSPAQRILGEYATPKAIADLEAQLGLDRPLGEQYVAFLTDYAKGNFGTSLRNRRPVLDAIKRELPHTLHLALAGMLVSIVVGVSVGIISAMRPNSWIDNLGRFLALLGISVPVFFSGILLILFFSVQLKWFPTIGAGKIGDIGSIIRHLVLPAIAVGTLSAGVTMRMTRSSMLEVLSQDYIRTAYSKGVSSVSVYLKHALRNAAIPIIIVIGLNFGNMLGGAVLTETVFSRPGLGKLIVDAILWKDYPMAQAAIFLFAIMFLLVNLLTDLTYAVLDPRISYE